MPGWLHDGRTCNSDLRLSTSIMAANNIKCPAPVSSCWPYMVITRYTAICLLKLPEMDQIHVDLPCWLMQRIVIAFLRRVSKQKTLQCRDYLRWLLAMKPYTAILRHQPPPTATNHRHACLMSLHYLPMESQTDLQEMSHHFFPHFYNASIDTHLY